MIHSDPIIMVSGDRATLNNDIYIYKNNKNLVIRFQIVNPNWIISKLDSDDLLQISEASSFILRWMKGDIIKKTFNDQPIKKGKACFTITDELTDEDVDIGDYDFQISLVDQDGDAILSIPPVMGQLHIRSHIFELGEESLSSQVGYALVDSAQVQSEGQSLDVFDTDGNYIKTIWSNKDTITAEKLNKIEDAIESNTLSINALSGIDGQINEVNERVDNVSSQIDTIETKKLDKNGILSMANMGQDVKEAMTGGSVAVVGKDMILKENIAQGQVTYDKTSFLNILGKNIFYPNINPDDLRVNFDENTGMTNISGTPTANKRYQFAKIYLKSGRYTFSLFDVQKRESIYIKRISDGVAITNLSKTKTETYVSFTIDTDDYYSFELYGTIGTIIDFSSKIMLENKSYLTEFEVVKFGIKNTKYLTDDEINYIINSKLGDENYSVLNSKYIDIDIQGSSINDNIYYKLVQYTGQYFKNAKIFLFRSDNSYITIKSNITMNEEGYITLTEEFIKLRIYIDVTEAETNDYVLECKIININSDNNLSFNRKLEYDIKSPLYDKKIGFLGDSFTDQSYYYGNYIAERTGCKCYNYGIGGTRVCLNTDSGLSMIHRVKNMDDDLDIICLYGGINDASKYDLMNSKLGTIDDTLMTEEEIANDTIDAKTFYSGYKTCISELIKKYPGKTIVAIIPPHVLNAESGTTLTAYTGIDKVVKAEREIAEYYGVPTIDLYKNCQCLNNHPTNVALYRIASDNIHPNKSGHERKSYDIQKGLENIICK